MNDIEYDKTYRKAVAAWDQGYEDAENGRPSEPPTGEFARDYESGYEAFSEPIPVPNRSIRSVPPG